MTRYLNIRRVSVVKMKKKESGRIWISGNCVHTDNKHIWDKINGWLKTTLYKERDEPNTKLDIKKYQFLQLIGDLTAEYRIHGRSFIDRQGSKKKIEKYLRWEYKNKIRRCRNDLQKNKIDEKLKQQLAALKKMEIESKIQEINNHFKKKGLDGLIFDEERTQFQLKVYSFMGPEEEAEIAGPKSRIILFGPYEPKIIKFCDETSFYMNKKLWNNSKDRFHEVVVRETPVKGPTHIIPIEQYLERDLENERKLFRKKGPLWVDLDSQGYVVERDEVDEIIDRFNEKQFQFLIGEAASGKTAIVASIGYRLAKEQRWNVNILPSKAFQYTTVDNLVKEMDFFNPQTEDGLIILEDLHKNAPDIVYILEHMIPKKSRFLLVARESYKIGLKQEELDFLNKFEVKGLEKENFFRVAEDLIDMYKKNIGDERKKDFQKLDEEHITKIKRVADGNLWILSYLLGAWSPDKITDKEIVYDKVRKDIDDLQKEFENKYNVNDVTVALLTLATLSILEVGMLKSFLNERYGKIKVNELTLKKLCEYGEIEYVNGYYSIPHSALATLYIETATFKSSKKDYTDMLIEISDQLELTGFSGNDEEFILEIIRAYLKTHPKNYLEVITQIPSYVKYTQFKDHFLPISFSKLIQDFDMTQILIKMIEEDNDENFIRILKAIKEMTYGGWNPIPRQILRDPYKYTHFINNIKKDAGEFVKKINGISRLSSIIRNEQNVKRIADYQRVFSFGIYPKDFYNSYLEELDLNNLISKLENKNTRLDDSIRVLEQLYALDKNILDVIKTIIRYKTGTGISLSELGLTCRTIHEDGIGYSYGENQNLIKYLIDLTDIDQLILKMGTEKLSGLSLSFPYIKEQIKGNKIRIENILNTLSIKINKEQDIIEIFYLFSGVAYMGKKFSVDLINRIDVKRIISMIEKSMIEKVDRFELFLRLFGITAGHFLEEKIDAVRLISEKFKIRELLSEKIIREILSEKIIREILSEEEIKIINKIIEDKP